MTARADVTLARAAREALDLLRRPPVYAADVHRNIEAAELVLTAGLALYERDENGGEHAHATPA